MTEDTWRVEGLFSNDLLVGQWMVLNDTHFGVQWPVKIETAVEIWELLKQSGYDVHADRFRIVNIDTNEVILCTIL